jgi:hypothetical protein
MALNRAMKDYIPIEPMSDEQADKLFGPLPERVVNVEPSTDDEESSIPAIIGSGLLILSAGLSMIAAIGAGGIAFGFIMGLLGVSASATIAILSVVALIFMIIGFRLLTGYWNPINAFKEISSIMERTNQKMQNAM